MTITIKTLIESKDAENAQTTQYTATGVKTIIDKFTAVNHTASAATISVNLVPNTGSAAYANLITVAKTLQASESYTFPEIVGHVLGAGDFISTIASVGNTIGIRASGREVS